MFAQSLFSFFIELICCWCCILYSFKRVLSIWLFLFFFFDLPAGSADLLQKDFRVVCFVTLVFSLHVFMSNFYSVINELCHWAVHSFIEFVPGVKTKQRNIGCSGRSSCLICIFALSGDSEVPADRRAKLKLWSEMHELKQLGIHPMQTV